MALLDVVAGVFEYALPVPQTVTAVHGSAPGEVEEIVVTLER
jgi:hypothetical protein